MTYSDEAVEKAARAMYDADCAAHDMRILGHTWASDVKRQPAYRLLAQAALASLPSGGGVKMREALEQIKALCEDPNSSVMLAWDRARASLVGGNRGSLPRDIMESGLAEFWTIADEALAALTPPGMETKG